MIVNLRGTSGSGKTTIAKELLRLASPGIVFRVDKKRKRPEGYWFNMTLRPLVIMGHYETPCGGCDTIPNYAHLFDMIRRAHDHGNDVFFEGLLVSGDVKWTTALHRDGYPLQVVGLDVPIELCLESVNLRRRAKNPDAPPLNPKNTIAKHRCIQGAMKKLEAAGIPTEWQPRDRALKRILELLSTPSRTPSPPASTPSSPSPVDATASS